MSRNYALASSFVHSFQGLKSEIIVFSWLSLLRLGSWPTVLSLPL